MTPYEMISATENAPDLWQGVLMALGWGAFFVTALYRIVKRLIRGGEKAVDKLVEKVVSHEKLAPLNTAAQSMGELTALVQETATGVAEMKCQLTEMAEKHKDLAHCTLYNSLANIYFDMLAQEKFSNSMYRRFTQTLTLYHANEFNGEIDGYAKVLAKWQQTGIKPKH